MIKGNYNFRNILIRSSEGLNLDPSPYHAITMSMSPLEQFPDDSTRMNLKVLVVIRYISNNPHML